MHSPAAESSLANELKAGGWKQHSIPRERRYQTYDELYGYCYKVAGTVALMTTPVMGINPSYTVRLSATPGLVIPCTFGLTQDMLVACDFEDVGQE